MKNTKRRKCYFCGKFVGKGAFTVGTVARDYNLNRVSKKVGPIILEEPVCANCWYCVMQFNR